MRDSLNQVLAYANRHDAPGVYLVVAIDDLPSIREANGHDIADTAMVAVGQALNQCFRDSDIVGRVALDDFGAGYTSFRHLKALLMRALTGAGTPKAAADAARGGLFYLHDGDTTLLILFVMLPAGRSATAVIAFTPEPSPVSTGC